VESSSCLLLLTTIPGLEDLALKEAEEKLRILRAEVKPSHVGGRLLIEIPGEQLAEAFKLRSVEHIIRLLKVFPVEESAEGLNTIYREVYEASIPLASTFRITCERIGSHNYTSMDVQRVAGQAVVDKYGVKVDLENPETIVRMDVARSLGFLGIQLTRKPLHVRYQRVYQHPSALNPVIAYGMLRLAGLREGEKLLDAFCGGGTIIIEAAQAWENLDPIGVDINPKSVEGAWRNAASAGVSGKVKFLVGDARRLEKYLPEGWIPDRVVSNLPFGIRSGRVKALPKLYGEFLQSLHSLQSQGVVCLLTAQRSLLEASALEAGYRITGARKILYGGLESWIMLLRPS